MSGKVRSLLLSVTAVILVVLLTYCGGTQQKAIEGESSYPAPRFPALDFKAVNSVEGLMPYARKMASAKGSSGLGAGYGMVNKGETVLIVPDASRDGMVLEALRRALEERGVKVQIAERHELAGVSREDVDAVERARHRNPENGYLEASNWARSAFADDAGVEWLKERRPDLYEKAFPKEWFLSPHLQAVEVKMGSVNVGKQVVAYLDKHPEVKAVFFGGPLSTNKKYLVPQEDKLYGPPQLGTRWNMVNEVATYPYDVWRLTEEIVMEPIGQVDKVHVTDPEGTDLSFDVNEQQAAQWAKGAYLQSHIFLSPTQAGGRHPLSFVDYPLQLDDWNPMEPLIRPNGVVAGTVNHTGWYPKIEIHFKDGYAVDVKGGGLYGDLFREFLKYPKIHDLTYPYLKHPGYFHFYEIALGTNPKFFRQPDLFASPTPFGVSQTFEISRTGVLHMALGVEFRTDPITGGVPNTLYKFADPNKLPRNHGFHTHQYFPTYKVHLRNTDNWLTLIDRGHMTALDDPEVKALASRYGDPDAVLAEAWIPEIAGINAPGRYDDYAAQPWKHAKQVIDKVVGGTYEHYYPPAKAK